MSKEIKYRKNTCVMRCTCEHPYFDKKFGPFMRTHNRTKQSESSSNYWRCIVCSKDKT